MYRITHQMQVLWTKKDVVVAKIQGSMREFVVGWNYIGSGHSLHSYHHSFQLYLLLAQWIAKCIITKRHVDYILQLNPVPDSALLITESMKRAQPQTPSTYSNSEPVSKRSKTNTRNCAKWYVYLKLSVFETSHMLQLQNA
jgi:hypothetical protein